MKSKFMKLKKKNSKKFQKRALKLGFFTGIIFVVAVLFAANFVFQIYKNPAAIVGALEIGNTKTIEQTWKSYKSLFQENSTSIISPVFLAALAQVESAGNTFASQSWNVKFNKGWKGFFSPRSSSVGLYQFTQPTFKWASKYCIHNGKVQKKGPWYKVDSCWFNSLYTRFVPSHAIEVASSYLDINVRKLTKNKNVSQKNLKRLAAIIHLCGVSKAKKLVRFNFNLRRVSRCGSHSSLAYIKKIERLEKKITVL